MSDRSRRHAAATSAAMKRSARARTCPQCQRGNALKRTELDDGAATTCRWCDYEHWSSFWPVRSVEEKP